MYTLSLEIINKCNLNCTYCYLGEKKNTYMSLETAQKAKEEEVNVYTAECGKIQEFCLQDCIDGSAWLSIES